LSQSKEYRSTESTDDSAFGSLLARTGSQTRVLLPPHALLIDGGASPDHALGRRTPRWLWWHLLGLDAPTVSLIWAVLFARSYGVRLALSEIVILCITVWIIYIGDRLLDGWKAADPEALQRRHLFCAEHRTPLIYMGVLAAVLDIWLITQSLEAAELFAGLKLAAIVGVYMLVVHARPRIARFLPKELAVGILFATGTTLPVWSKNGGTSGDWRCSLALFALLCWLNCFSIECWEKNGSKYIQNRKAEQILWGKVCISEAAAGLAMLALALLRFGIVARDLTAIVVSVSLSALLIFCLNYFRNLLSLSALRVLVDLVLVVAALVALTVCI
jgi:hypothetical protein